VETHIVSIILFSILLLGVIAGVVAGQGSSFDTAEEVSLDDERTCIYISQGEDHYFKFYVSAPDTLIKVSINPDSGLDADLYVYDSSYTLIGNSTATAGSVDSVTFTASYAGYYYIKVHGFGGEGYYNLLVSTTGDVASEPNCDSSSSSNSCGCDWSCPIPGVGDPCAMLCNVYCAVTSFIDAINSFFNSIVSFFNQIAEAIQNFFNTLITGMQNAVSAIVDIFTSIAEGMQSFLNTVWSGIASFFTAVANTITGFFNAMWNGIATLVNSIVGFFTGIWEGFVNGLQNFASAIANGIADFVGSLGGPFTSIGDWLRENGLLTLGIILIFIGLVIRPAMYVGILLTIAGLFTSPLGLNPGYVILGLGVLIILAAARR